MREPAVASAAYIVVLVSDWTGNEISLAGVVFSRFQSLRNVSMSIRIIVADDHTLIRQTLSRLLEEEEDMEVVGQAPDGDAVMELTMQLRPDVVVMDVGMPPVLSGLEATRWIHGTWPDVKVIALSMHAEKAYVAEMLKSGARGYLLKDGDLDELLIGIRAVAAGKIYLGSGVEVDEAVLRR
jgi:two-component system response regulator NreC